MQVKCLYDSLESIESLLSRFHPKNRNTHPEEQIKRLAEILQYQGIRYPVKVSKQSGYITSGHGRVLAAKLLGWPTFPVNFQDYDDGDQEYADVQADNAIAAWAEMDLSAVNTDIGELGPDFNVDYLGFRDFKIEPADKLEPQCDEDEVPDKVETKTKLGDIYQLGNHRLMCGDSTQIDSVDQLMKGEKAELCFTSPPYSDQREYNGGKELSTQYLASFIRSSHGKVNYFAVNLGFSRKNGEINQYWDDYIKEAKELGLKLLSWNVWDRSNTGYSIGNATAMFAIEHEFIFVFGIDRKDLNRTIPNKTAGESNWGNVTKRQSNGELLETRKKIVNSHRQLGTVFKSDIARNVKNEGINHPAMFPIVFPESYIEAMTSSNDSVYEPFAGSGSTMIACEKTNRKCYAMELDPHYCDIIVARWEKYTGKKAELLNG